MEISKEDQERIEKKGLELYPPEYPHGDDWDSMAQFRYEWIEGATHEHLTQVLPLREKLAEKDKEIESLRNIDHVHEFYKLQLFKKQHEIDTHAKSTVEVMKLRESLEEHDGTIMGLEGLVGALESEITKLKEENERLRGVTDKLYQALKVWVPFHPNGQLKTNDGYLDRSIEALTAYDTQLTETKKP